LSDKNEQTNNRPEGWTENMRPLAAQAEKPPVLGLNEDPSQPVVKSEEQAIEEEGREYWRKKFEEVQARNEANAPFANIMEALKTNGDLVDVLEKHMRGEFVETRAQANAQTIFDGDEEDDYGNPIPKNSPQEETQQAKPAEETSEQARQRGKMEAAAEIELKTFLDNLINIGGVPDHIADKFVNTISNPSGFMIADLYAAFENKEAREKAQTPQPATEEGGTPRGAPVASAGGSTDKPTGDKYQETPDNEDANYVANPNIMG